MNLRNGILLIALITAAIGLIEVNNRASERAAKIEERFKAAVIAAAPTGQLEYFAFPNSEDYSNIPQDPKNPINKPKVELGRIIIQSKYTGIKPMNNAGYGLYNCVICHHDGHGFTNPTDVPLGDGGIIFGDTVVRNPYYTEDSLCDLSTLKASTFLNIAYSDLVLWSGMLGYEGANSGIDFDQLAHFEHPKQLNDLEFKGPELQAFGAGVMAHRFIFDPTDELTKDSYIGKLFYLAFPNDPHPINDINAGLAIAAFERTVLANEAPFQKWLAGDKNALSETDKRNGLHFFKSCATSGCHNSPAFGNDSEFHNFDFPNMWDCYDLVEYDEAAANGRFIVTGDSSDIGKYKVPQLYNVSDHECWGHSCCYDDMDAIVQAHNYNLEFSYLKKCNNFVTVALRDPNLSRYTKTQGEKTDAELLLH